MACAPRGPLWLCLGSIAFFTACSATSGSDSPRNAAAGTAGVPSASGGGSGGDSNPIGPAGAPGAGGTTQTSVSCTPNQNGKLAVDCASAGIVLVPPYDQSYTCVDLGEDGNIPPKWGGLTTQIDDPHSLLVGGSANTASGLLYRRGILRDAQCHVAGFSNVLANAYADGGYNDGGVVYGPGGVMFLARWPINELAFMKPGSLSIDKIIDTSALGVGYALAALGFVPEGFGGAGALKLVAWPDGQWYSAQYSPDATGTFDVTSVTHETSIGGGPEGFVYIAAGNAEFPHDSMLVSEWTDNRIAAYDVDANGNPIVATRRDFIVGLTGAEGAFLDPLSGDFLFSTFADVNRVIAIRGFKPPAPIPR